MLILLSVSISGCITDASKDIRAVLNKQVEGWNNGNIDSYMQGYRHNDSLLFIGSSGPTYGYEATLERYKKAYPDKAHMGILSFAEVQMKRLSREYYFVSGKWNLDRTQKSVSGYFTLIFKNIEGKWFIVADHSS